MSQVIKNAGWGNPHLVSDKVFTTKRPGIRYVVGPDLDVDLCKSLAPGDHVLVEVNGGRYWTQQHNPMVAEEPWEVVENEWHGDKHPEGQIVLKHKRVPQPLVLSYKELLAQPKSNPAVFKTSNARQKHDALPEGPLFVILQLVAYKLHEDKVAVEFPMPSRRMMEEFVETLEDDRLKVGLFEEWVDSFRRSVKASGWQYISAKRIAQRAGVGMPVVIALAKGDYKTLLAVPDDALIRLRIECHWLPMLLRQSSLIQHDHERVAVK